MNTTNRMWIMVIAASAVLAVLTGCPQPSGGSGSGSGTQPQTVVCPCDPKEHYVPCDCVAKGTANCTCIVLARDEITEDVTGVKIPVYQTAGVSDSAITADVTNVTTGYSSVGGSKKLALQGKVSAIHIIPTASNGYYEYEVKNGKVILKFKTGLSSNEIDDCFSSFVDNVLDGLNL